MCVFSSIIVFRDVRQMHTNTMDDIAQEKWRRVMVGTTVEVTTPLANEVTLSVTVIREQGLK